MNRLKTYNNYIKENDLGYGEPEDLAEEAVEKENFSDIKDEIRKMIKDSANSEDESVISNFIDSFIKDSEETKIVGLVNSSDVYEFYLKYRNEIDEILSDSNFFEKVPSEMSVFSLYEYVIKGTNKAVLDIVTKLKKTE